MSTTLKYRPDLDGIRALAVLAVIIFHIDAAWLPGGFLGVDMFFVLSGYLITTIISREMQNGSFSFLEFYKRRAKRILPVFSCVLLCTSLAAAIFFLSFDLRQYVKSAVFALLFSANLFFARRGGYFDADAAEKPLQHIWSLSLEEQFYFVFPVLLIAFFRFSKGRNIRQFILLLIVLSLLSVFLPTFGMDPYFLPYVRAYELLIGALFAFISPSQNNDRFSTPVVGWAMMAVIAAMLLLPYGVLPGEGNIERLLCCTAVGGLIYSGKTLQLQYRQTVEPQAHCVYRFDFLFAVFVALGGLGRHALCLHGQHFADVCDCIGRRTDVGLVRFVLLLRRNTSATDKEFHHQEIYRGHRRLFRPADSCRRLPDDCQTGRIRGKPIYG